MVSFSALVVLLACVGVFAFAHSPAELSKLYKSYQASKGKHSIADNKQKFRKAVVAKSVNTSNAEELAAMKNLFVPPRPDQTPIDYHPQLKALPGDGEEIIYYSWHIHTYFFHEDENVTAKALELRDAFMSAFTIETCSDDCFMGGPWDTCSTGETLTICQYVLIMLVFAVQ